MLSKIARGVTIAVRTGAAPVMFGARLAQRMGEETPEGVPSLRAGWDVTSKVVLDEFFFAAEIASAPFVNLRQARRVVRELGRAATLFEKRGWLDEPTGYHRTPPALEIASIDEVKAPLLPYRHLRFESGYEPHPGEPGRTRWLSYTANRTAHAWLLKHPGPMRPWLVCVPGYRMGHPLVDFTGFKVRWLHKTLGLNIAIPVIPLHGPRRVGRRGGDGFFTGDFMDTLHAQAQAVWDTRRVISWLRSHGAPSVGIYGVSLGGYTAALAASLATDLDCVIAGIPATDFPRLMQAHVPAVAHGAVARVGLSFEKIERVLSVVSPLELKARVPRERRFLYAGLADRLASPDHARDLWEHWEEPRVAWYHGSHVSFLWEPEVKELLLDAFRISGLVSEEDSSMFEVATG